MNILYVSSTCSKKTILNIFNNSSTTIAQSMQKFSHLLLEGFVKNDAKITALSTIPIDSTIIKDLKIERQEVDNDIEYIYTKTSSNKYVNAIYTFLSSFSQTIKWGRVNKRKDSVIFFDVLKVSICMGSLLASKLLHIKTIGLVTDIPGLMVGGKKNLFSRLATFVNKRYINSFDSYVLLTEQMNELVNFRKRPYIVMEGLVDSTMIDIKSVEKDTPRNIIYAGGIYQRYGVKDLIDAFMRVEDNSIQLTIYGQGDLKEYVKKCSITDHRVRYLGVVNNKEVVGAQLKATLLVNPRPTHEDFTKYSFPSKNMEYMVSGTPMLTTKLPGMPREYYNYIFLIEEESVNGIEIALRKIISMDEKELSALGAKAKRFVLENKNNMQQSKRLLNFMEEKVL